MKRKLSFSAEAILGTGLLLVALSGILFWILSRAQNQLAELGMEDLLRNESLAFQTLVAARPEGLDVDVNALFIEQFNRTRPAEFFRYFDAKGKIVRESLKHPEVPCRAEDAGTVKRLSAEGHSYRSLSTRFQPEVDDELKNPPPFERPWLCLIVGVDEAPSLALVQRSRLQSVPVFAFAVLGFLLVLVFLLRKLTGDLSNLAAALEHAHFSPSQSFPNLPNPHTPEVAAVVDRLTQLHARATKAYQETWLFFGRAAHQLRTPVSAIQATLEVLLRKDRSREELLSGLQDLDEGIHGLAGLTQQLILSSRLSYSAPMPGESASLIKVTDELTRLFRAKAAEKRIQLKSLGEPVRVMGEARVVSELLAPLIENAIQYSPPGSAVAIEWKVVGDKIQIEVSDSGPGLPNAVKSRLFEPFVRGDERVSSGAGLGLSIAKKAASLCGGDLELLSSSESGTRFRAVLRSTGQEV